MLSPSKLLISSRANFGPYGISPITLSFARADEEVQYLRLVLRTSVVHIRFAFGLGLLLIAGYGILDPFIYQNRSFLIRAYAIRFLLISPLLVAFIIITFRRNYEALSQLAGTAIFLIVGCSWFLFSVGSDLSVILYNFPAVIMTSIYGFFFAGLLFRNAFISGLIVNVTFCAAIWSVDIPFAMGIGVNTSMLVVYFLIAMAAYQKELIARQLFVSERRERDTLDRQVQGNLRYLEWLRQLARFLRHEVRQPIARINSTVEVLQLQTADQDTLRAQITNAGLEAQHVWNLVERASRATDAEAFIRESEFREVELYSLLTEVVEGFRQTYSGVEISFHGAPSVNVLADSTLLKEAVSNLLSNAASFADEGSTIELTLSIEQGSAVIAVWNKGPLIEGDTERLFGPFASSRSGPKSEHQGLGLYLVRLIAEHHGGAAQISNLSNQSGVLASFEIPLVA